MEPKTGQHPVVLVVPPGGYFAERWKDGGGMPELGLLSIAAVLEREGIPVIVLPCSILGFDIESFGCHLATLQPRFVGVTTTTENRFQSFDVLRTVKQVHPGVTTVIGGPHITNAAADTLAHLSFIDVAVRGEGEYTALGLARAIEADRSFDTIEGISYRHADGSIVHNKPRTPIASLDELPFPARHLVDHAAYRFSVDVPGRGRLPAANLMTSRGCPFSCNFCATPANWGRKVRTMSVERVLEEIDLVYHQYGARVLWFYDDTFNVNRKRVIAICEGILAQNFDVSWFCEVRIDLLDRELLTIMKRAGCFHIGFGVEAGSERVRREIIGKDFDVDQARMVISWCNDVGIIANPFFVISHPTETRAELNETLQLMDEFADKARESVSILHIYPGTSLETWAREHGQLPTDFSWTKRRDARIITLPAAQGDVPLFLDRLSWWDIGRVLFQWSSKQSYSVGNKVPAVLKNIRSWRDIVRYGILFLCFLRYRLIPKLIAQR